MRHCERVSDVVNEEGGGAKGAVAQARGRKIALAKYFTTNEHKSLLFCCQLV